MAELNTFLNGIITQIVNPLILLMSGAAFVVFVWGIFEFVYNAADEKKREEGKKAIFWGIVGLVIIFGAYGIINVALSTFSLSPIQTTLPAH